jgi:type I restriction enzyme S subunit
MNINWQTKQLGEICDVFADGDWIESKDQSEDGIRLIQTGNIGEGAFKDRGDKARYITESTFKRLRCTEIFEGDCLVSRLPDPVGRACILPALEEKLITAVDCTIIRFNPKIAIPKYFSYYSQSVKYLNDIERETSGTTRKRISRSKLAEICLPFPPLPEQKRIVAILDEAFSGISRAKEIAEKNLANMKELFESFLQSELENENWEEKSIQDICNVVNGYAFSSKDFKPTNTIKSIKITNVGVKEFVEEEGNFLPEKYRDKLSEVQAREGNIVIALTRTIISTGLKVAIVPKSYDGALVNQRVAALVPHDKKVDHRYLYYCLTTNKAEKYVLDHVNTLMQPNLSINDLREMPIQCPSLVEQKEIVKKIETLRAETVRLEIIFRQKLADLDELKKSLLQKAFSGALTGTAS